MIDRVSKLGPLLAAVVAAASLLVSIQNNREIRDVHITVNSRMSELLATTQAASKAEGILQEKERAK